MNLSETLFERAQKLIPGGVNSPVRAFRAVGGTPVFVPPFAIKEHDEMLRESALAKKWRGLHPGSPCAVVNPLLSHVEFWNAVDAFEAVMPARLRSQSPPTGDAALRIVVPDDPLIADMTPDVRHARESMADCASAAGHHVERRRSPVAKKTSG